MKVRTAVVVGEQLKVVVVATCRDLANDRRIEVILKQDREEQIGSVAIPRRGDPTRQSRRLCARFHGIE